LITIASGSAPNYAYNGLNNVKLSYNTNTTYLTLIINGGVVYDAPVTGIDNLDGIKSANLQLYQQIRDITVGQVDNFVLTTGTSLPFAPCQDSFVAPDRTILCGRWTETGDAIWSASSAKPEHRKQSRRAGCGGNDDAGIGSRPNGLIGLPCPRIYTPTTASIGAPSVSALTRPAAFGERVKVWPSPVYGGWPSVGRWAPNPGARNLFFFYF